MNNKLINYLIDKIKELEEHVNNLCSLENKYKQQYYFASRIIADIHKTCLNEQLEDFKIIEKIEEISAKYMNGDSDE